MIVESGDGNRRLLADMIERVRKIMESRSIEGIQHEFKFMLDFKWGLMNVGEIDQGKWKRGDEETWGEMIQRCTLKP